MVPPAMAAAGVLLWRDDAGVGVEDDAVGLWLGGMEVEVVGVEMGSAELQAGGPIGTRSWVFVAWAWARVNSWWSWSTMR